MRKMKRREFVKKSTALTFLGGSALLGCGSDTSNDGPAVHTRKKYQWNMVTTWPPHFPVMGEGADQIATWIDEMSEGQLKIQVYGGGELVPALETFDAVSQGTAQMGHSASYYWAGKVPAGQFFTAVPFGMNAQQMNSWIYSGGGLELWRDLYAPFNIIPFPAGNTGMQMGGWFNKEINSASDLQGLKMRIPGLGGKVIAKAGGAPILTAGGEIYTNLDRGVIDATEWVGPYHDYLMGFHRIAKFYYYPGWHEPGPVLELIVNKAHWEGLPKNLQTIIQTAAYRANVWMLAQFEAQNAIYLQKIIDEGKVDIRKFPDPVLTALKKYANDVVGELTSSDAAANKIFDSFQKFRKAATKWANVSEKVYYTFENI